MASRAVRELQAAIRELVFDGCADKDEMWEALAERFGEQQVDFRFRVWERELDERAPEWVT